jgi:hypothetical protein
MTQAVGPTVTPLSVSEDFSSGMALGTGNYFAFAGTPYLRDFILHARPDVGVESGL